MALLRLELSRSLAGKGLPNNTAEGEVDALLFTRLRLSAGERLDRRPRLKNRLRREVSVEAFTYQSDFLPEEKVSLRGGVRSRSCRRSRRGRRPRNRILAGGRCLSTLGRWLT